MARSLRIVAASLALSVVACGDDETSSSGSGGGSTSGTTSTGTPATGASTGTNGGPSSSSSGAGAGSQGGGDTGGGDTGGGDTGGGPSNCCYPYDHGEPADNTPATSPIAESGTRLRARWIDGGGNARAFKGFHDEELDLDCVFERAIDGVVRCLPMVRGTSSYFANDDCTERVQVEDRCGEYGLASTFERLDAPEGCSERYGFRIHTIELDEPLGLSTVYYPDGLGGCLPLTIDGPQVFPMVAIDSAIYASATAVVEPGDDRLSQGFLESEDGARMATWPIDDTYGTCIWSGYGDDARCVPLIPTSHEQVAYSDATCETLDADLYVDLSGGTCEAPALSRYDSATCGIEYFASEPATADYYRDGDACAEGEPDGAVGFGAPLALDDFAPIDALGVGTGRLQVYTFAQAGQAFAQTYLEHFWDTELEASCEPLEYGGDLRCVPVDRGAPVGNAYADAACTEPLVNWIATECATPKFGMRAVDNDCNYLDPDAIFRTGAPYLEPVVYVEDDEGDCVGFDVPDGAVLFEGTLVPPEDLVLLEVVVD
jgi:hypothetical protein